MDQSRMNKSSKQGDREGGIYPNMCNFHKSRLV